MKIGVAAAWAAVSVAGLGQVAAPVSAQDVAPTTTSRPPSAEVVPTANRPVERARDVVPYTINAGDEVEVYVWGEERLQRTIRVLPDGTIAMPLVGQVVAQGLLPEQLEAAVSARLATQYRGSVPQVTVSVRNPSGLLFSVVGKVRSPGTFTPGRYVNLLEALSLAGGAADFANLDNVTIVRKTPTGLTNIRARLGNVFKNGVSSKADSDAIPRIQSGDTIVVP